LYPDGTRTVISYRASSESEVKAWTGHHDIVHLSVHGEFLPGDPLLSHIRFSEGSGEDGKLTAVEMFGLDLRNASLVVLSACETGRSKITASNEIIGIERGLLFAGAKNLVLSYWNVNAASTELWMTVFYREAQLQQLGIAAQRAALTVMQRPEYRHPYYWAAFMLVGV
jgi:CHAT domain-containing protein